VGATISCCNSKCNTQIKSTARSRAHMNLQTRADTPAYMHVFSTCCSKYYRPAGQRPVWRFWGWRGNLASRILPARLWWRGSRWSPQLPSARSVGESEAPANGRDANTRVGLDWIVLDWIVVCWIGGLQTQELQSQWLDWAIPTSISAVKQCVLLWATL